MEDKKLMKILKAIANENRLVILKCLHKDKELSVGDLAEASNLPFRSVSGDLSVLRRAGLVKSRNFYLNRLYSIDISNFPKELLIFLRG